MANLDRSSMRVTDSAGLVSTADMTGQPIYSSIDGQHIGDLDHLMVDKVTGRIAYADIGFGGFLGLAQDHHFIPWNKLSYSPERGGFVTDLTKEHLEAAPERGEGWQSDRAWEQRTYDHYKVPYYWI